MAVSGNACGPFLASTPKNWRADATFNGPSTLKCTRFHVFLFPLALLPTRAENRRGTVPPNAVHLERSGLSRGRPKGSPKQAAQREARGHDPSFRSVFPATGVHERA
ncbi:unnamed protein product [Phaeothamnion confervicola]